MLIKNSIVTSSYLFNRSLIIFDCDGVIFDSNDLKTQAFAEVLREEGFSETTVDAFTHYHQTNGGISRYVKFRYLIEVILQRNFDADLYQRMLKKFSEKCVQLYQKTPFTSGVSDLIKKLHSRRIPLFVASGGKEEELHQVFEQRGIKEYFSGIYGSPKTKIECARLALTNQETQNGLFIGDALSDLKTALHFNLDFLAILKYSENRTGLAEKCGTHGAPMIHSFSDISLSS